MPGPSAQNLIMNQHRISSVLSVFLMSLCALSARQALADEVIRDQTLHVSMGGHEVGTTRARDVRTANGYRFERQSDLRLRRGQLELAIQTKTVAYTDAKLRPLRYEFEKKDAAGVMRSTGTIRGQSLILQTSQDDGKTRNEIAIPTDVIFATAFEHLVRENLKDRYALRRNVILEEMGASIPMETEVAAKPFGYLLKSRFAGIETMERVDPQGMTLHSETPALNAIAYPVGTAPPAGIQSDAPDILAKTTWPAPKLPTSPKWVRYRIHTPDAQRFSVPEDIRQKVVARSDEWLDIAVNDGPSTTSPISKKGFKTYTEATPYEAIHDDRLVKVARRETKGLTSTREKIDALVDFVYQHVDEKALDRGYAPALSTLDSRRGDCTEHSVLLSALLRAIDIPTRLVDGVVVGGGRAGYHEWVEVFVDGTGFIPADPTFGEFPASPARLKLAEGSSSPEGMLRLSLAAGRLLRPGVKVEVVDAGTKAQ